MTKSRDIADSINRIDSSAADATAMTIDSSENVLVGKTSTGIANVGHQIQTNGLAQHVADGAISLQLNRKSSNGDIAQLRKDGTTVGALGVDSGGFYLDGEANHTGLIFGGGAIAPRLNSSSADNTVNLGISSQRFENLFLGGGVYLGGTGSANALDDYEEGTWTPNYSITGASFNMSLQLGYYVKVGRMVTASARVRGQRSGGSGGLTLTGLPFTTNTTASLQPAASIGFTNGWSASPKGAFAGANSTIIGFKKSGSTSALSNIADDITHSDVSTSSTSSNDLILSITYMTS